MQFLFRLLIIYLIYKIVVILLRKGVQYYLAFKSLRKRQKQGPTVRRAKDYNLGAFEIEDAKFEEIQPGKDD